MKVLFPILFTVYFHLHPACLLGQYSEAETVVPSGPKRLLGARGKGDKQDSRTKSQTATERMEGGNKEPGLSGPATGRVEGRPR